MAGNNGKAIFFHILDKLIRWKHGVKMEVSQKTIKSNILWNVVGASFFCACQWIMSILIVHIAGYKEAGYLSLGLSLTNTFINIGYYSIRSFQVSDVDNQYYSSTYVSHRLITCILAYVLYLTFVIVNGYSLYVTLFLLTFMLYRLLESFVDVFHGIDQKAWRLDIVGKSYIYRGILMLGGFIVIEIVTKDLVLTSVSMFCLCMIVVIFYDIPKARDVDFFRWEWNKERLWNLTKKCFPLLVYSLSINAIMLLPRYCLEQYKGSTILGYYASVSTPAAMIQLLAVFIFNPYIQLFAEYIKNNRKKKFLILIIRILFMIITLVILCWIASYFAGEWGLKLLFTEEIVPYSYLLVSTVFCCGLLALSLFLGTVLIVLREFKTLTIGALSGLFVSMISSISFIKKMGINGVNNALVCALSIVLIIYITRFVIYIKRWK